MNQIPIFHTDRLLITVLSPDQYKLMVRYQDLNREHLSPWEPLRAAGYFDDVTTQARLHDNLESFYAGASIPLVGLDKITNEIVCSANFTNIVHGAFQACHLGYSVSCKYEGKGLMFEMLEASIKYVFTELRLHRIMANYIPRNTRSGKLLKQLGFEKEGLAKSYLNIAGKWEDHILMSKLAE